MEAFSYSASHDLRAPLRSITGFSAILEEKYSPQLDEGAKRLIGIIRSSTKQMDQLIDDLLLFARTSSQHLSKSPVDMTIIVADIVNDLNQQNQGNSITWKIAELPEVKADAATIRQVWINLLSNAVKYSRNKTERVIEVGSWNEKQQVAFSFPAMAAPYGRKGKKGWKHAFTSPCQRDFRNKRIENPVVIRVF